MDMEASDPSFKKRKLAVPNRVPPAPKATGATGYRRPPSAHNQHPPSGGADRISNLADAILGEIVSLLPTKEAARTGILASRWRHIWCSAPLNLDCRGLVKHGDEPNGVVSRILSSHPGPGRRFCFDAGFLDVPAATLDALLRSSALDSLQELEFLFKLCYRPQKLQQLPPSFISRFSATLRVATIGNCNLPDNGVEGLHFPLLKQLGLEFVSVSECSLHGVIAGCPALERLLINNAFGFHCLRINSLTLRSVCVKNFPIGNDHLKELIVENAPCLQILLHIDFEHVSVVSAPKLQTLGCITDTFYISTQNDLPSLVFGSTVIQGLRVDTLTTVVSSVKILAISMKTLSLDIVIELMRCFPCLEKMYIEAISSKKKNEWRHQHQNLIKCLNIHLKTISFNNYLGTKSDINFASFFVLNARALELMTFQLEPRDYNEEFLAKQRRELQLGNKASRDAQFHFTADRCVRSISDIHHVRDLNLTDPFAW